MRSIPSRLTRSLLTEMTISGILRGVGFPHWLEVMNLYLGVLFSVSYRLSRTLNFSHYIKMPHSNFKERSHTFSSGTGKCSCGQTFDYMSERDMNMKLRMHIKFCPKPPKGFNKIRVTKKATTLREQQLNEAERMRKVNE